MSSLCFCDLYLDYSQLQSIPDLLAVGTTVSKQATIWKDNGVLVTGPFFFDRKNSGGYIRLMFTFIKCIKTCIAKDGTDLNKRPALINFFEILPKIGPKFDLKIEFSLIIFKLYFRFLTIPFLQLMRSFKDPYTPEIAFFKIYLEPLSPPPPPITTPVYLELESIYRKSKNRS